MYHPVFDGCGFRHTGRSQNLLNGLVCCQVISLEMELLPRLHDLLPFDSIYLALFLRHGYRYRKYHPCHILDISELYFTGPIGGRNHYFSGTKMTENKITDVCKKNWKDGKSKYCPQRQLSLESVWLNAVAYSGITSGYSTCSALHSKIM